MSQLHRMSAATVSVLLCLSLASLAWGGDNAQGPLDPPPTPWIDEQQWDGRFYFLYSHPARIEVYDLDQKLWLTPIELPQTPSSFAVDSDGLYVGFRSGTLSRFEPGGGGEFPLLALADEVQEVFVVGDYVYALFPGSGSYDSNLTSVVKWTGVQIDLYELIYTMQGFDAAPGLARAFVMIDQDLGYAELLPYGQLGDIIDSYWAPEHTAEQTWVFPDETLVADDSGMVIHADDLSVAADLGGTFEDLAFFGGVPIVLRGDRLIAYSPGFTRTGEIVTGLTGRRIAVRGDEVAVFHLGKTGVEAAWYSVHALDPHPPETELSPEGLVYQPEAVAIDQRNIVYLLSRNHHSVFRFAPDQGRYLDSIPLVGGAKYMTYNPSEDRLYLGYDSNRISKVQLAPDGSPAPEAYHFTTPRTLHRLTTAGDFLMVADYQYSLSVYHTTYGEFGSELSQSSTYRYPSRGYEWSDATRRLYWISIGVSPSDLYFEEIDVNGQIGDAVESPYHGGPAMSQPIRARSDGQLVLLGSGNLFDGATLDLVGDLGGLHVDALWWGNSMLTLVESGDDSELRLFGEDLLLQDSRTLDGSPDALLPAGLDALVLLTEGERPRFSRWNQGLDTDDLAVVISDDMELVDEGGAAAYTVTIRHRGSTTLAGVHVQGTDSGQLTDRQWTCTATGGSACGVGSGSDALDDVAVVEPGGALEYTITGSVRGCAGGTLRVCVRAQPPTGREYGDCELTEINLLHAVLCDDFESGDTETWLLTVP